MHPNVLQHQYAISSEAGKPTVLATKGILMCTGWYGWDAANGISFLCHFDHPWSARSVPHVLRDLRKIAPEDHSFRSVLVGGKEWFWSRKTRAAIRCQIDAQTELNIKVREGPVDGKWLHHRNLLVSAQRGHIPGNHYLEGSASPRGICWIFGPMQRAWPDAYPLHRADVSKASPL